MLGLLVFGLATQFMFSQTEELPEVRLDINYKYLDAIESDDVALSVKELEEEVAFFNVKESDMYEAYLDNYTVSFFIPKGRIVAIYNKDGKIEQTIERFKNIRLPISVMSRILEQYPNWDIVEDTYKVDYYDRRGVTQKQYKVKLKNKDKIKTVKLDEDGQYL